MNGKTKTDITHTVSGRVIHADSQSGWFQFTKDIAWEYQSARVRAAGGMTKNMGNFESVRIDVSIELPCLATEQKVKEAFNYATDWVVEKLDELTQAALGDDSPDGQIQL